MSVSTRARQLTFAAALCGNLDPIHAAQHASDQCLEALGGVEPDLAIMFFSVHHVHASMGLVSTVRSRLKARTLIGCSAEMVLGADSELEQAPGVSLFAASMPGVTIASFTGNDLPAPQASAKPGQTPSEYAATDLEQIARVAGFGPDHRGTILLADPFTTPSTLLLPALAAARNRIGLQPGPDRRPAPIIGGFASSGNRPGANVVVHNDRLYNAGLVGVSLSGAVRIDSLVSQGCKPIGQPLVITQSQGQMISQLGGRPALDVLTDYLDALDATNRQKLRGGLYLGRAVTEYKSRFGRDDFVIRNVTGVDRENKAIAVADLIRVGQTVQFHIRDAQTADEDLAMLLDAQKLHDTPGGALLFTCNGRGTRLFSTPHHDALAFARAFGSPTPAPDRAKGGSAIPPPPSPVPTAGFFCAGEIGPIGNEVFVHAQTVAAAMFRAPDLIA
jgi:small ligand-binding sensory domain FIST